MSYGFDTSKAILCAAIQLEECIDGRGCEPVLPEEVNSPTFFRIDIPRKEIRTRTKSGISRITNVAEIGGKIILQGVTPESERIGGGTSWTVSLDSSTGRFATGVTTEQAAVVIFGACTES